MKAGLAVILVLALGALTANYLLQDNGYVLINFRGYVIEMSVPVLIFLLLLAYVAVRTLVRLWRAPRQLGEAAARRRARKAGEHITMGYIELGQGNYARGEKLLTKGARNSATPLPNYLAAARAAQAQGDTARRDSWLAMAGEQEPRARATVLVTKAQLQLENGEREAAAATVAEVLALAPDNSAALRLAAELAVGAEDWAALEQTLPRLRKTGKLPAAMLDDWTTRTWAALLREAGADKARGKALWNNLPRHLRDQPHLVAARAASLAAGGEPRKAEALLRSALNSAWHPELILAYGDLTEPAAADRLRTVEKWLRDRPEDPLLLLVAARLCVATELWGKARSYYETSAGIRPEPRTWHELGQLLLQLGDQELAFKAFEQGLAGSYGGSTVPRLTNASLGD